MARVDESGHVRDVPVAPPGGWTADDLDLLSADGLNGESLRHVELIDGALVLAVPQTRLHEQLTSGLASSLRTQAPRRLTSLIRMDIKLGPRTRPCPDVLVIDSSVADDLNRTYYTPDEVRLVVEVVSPESEERDRKTKPSRYADAGIPHFWRIEDGNGKPVVYVYELDPATRTYALTGIHHSRLRIPVPFPIDIDLDNLPR
jgi:Uma2 family endonuclease